MTNKAFITVIGKDRVGIIADVTILLSSLKINIEDISQTILQGMFTMIMAVNLENSELEYDKLNAELKAKSAPLGVEIVIRHEAIFQAMHRI